MFFYTGFMYTNTMKRKIGLLIAIFIITAVTQIPAFRLTPMVQEFSPAGQGTRQTFTVINNENRPIAVRIEFAHRDIDIHGNETLEDASGKFSAFPPQMVVQPDSRQVVRVQWRGEPSVEKEQAYRLIARQLPVEFDREQQEGVSLNIMFVYQASVYVSPPEEQVDVVIEDVERTVDEEGNPLLSLELNNRGNVRTVIDDPSVTIRSTQNGTSEEITLQGAQLGPLSGVNVLAGNRRIVSVPWPDELPEGDLDATSFEYSRR